MSKRYALIEHSGSPERPDCSVEITRNFRKVVEFIQRADICARQSVVTRSKYFRSVYELPTGFPIWNQETLEVMALHMTRKEQVMNWRDALAYQCVNQGKYVDLSGYVRG